MIYLAKIEGHALCKVGYTVNVESKKNCISTYCPFPIEFIEVREGSQSLEFVMHHHLREHFFRREWFIFNDEVLSIFKNKKLEHIDNPKRWRKEIDPEYKRGKKFQKTLEGGE